jgi:hypothetical protein
MPRAHARDVLDKGGEAEADGEVETLERRLELLGREGVLRGVSVTSSQAATHAAHLVGDVQVDAALRRLVELLDVRDLLQAGAVSSR